MQLLPRVLSVLLLIAIKLDSSLSAQCRLSNDHKIYTCRGFRLNMLSASRNTRLQILEARIYDCKETEIPEGKLTFPNLQNLTVSCDLEKINKKAFEGLNQLLELDLGNNTLTALPDQVFVPLNELRALNLSYNQLEDLKQDMFEGLNKLKQLFLSHNRFTQIDQTAFHQLENLEEIYLNNNQLEIIPIASFSRLSKLSHIDLSYNEVKILTSAFTFTFNLKHVNFSHNEIKDVPLKVFQATRLEILDLSNNQLTVIMKESIQLETLKELYLQNNQISLLEITETFRTLPLSVLDVSNNRLVYLEDSFIQAAPKLVHLKISKNPWDCNCYDKMLALRRNLSLKIDPERHAGRDPDCVISINEGCIVNKSNLMEYYTIFMRIGSSK